MNTKHVVYRALMTALAILLLQTLLAPLAAAQCGYLPGTKIRPTKMQPGFRQAPALGGGRLLLVSDDQPGDRSDADAIVGFWKVAFVAQGNDNGIPDGAPIDFGYQQWHSDGTEILNSGARTPASGNFCLGVWKRVARLTYRLNHFALSSDANGNFIGPANIREEVVLDRDGNSFSGSFTIDQFDRNGTLLIHIAGRVSGTRLTVDSQP